MKDGIYLIYASPNQSLKIARVKAGLFQKEVAKEAGITSSSYYQIESGRKSTSGKTAKAIADALGVPIESIFNIQVEKAGDTNASQNENN